MHEYVWIPHIHSEVTENFSEYDLMDLPLIGKKRFSDKLVIIIDYGGKKEEIR